MGTSSHQFLFKVSTLVKKAAFDFNLRHTENIKPTEKYKEEIFSDIEVPRKSPRSRKIQTC